MRQSLFHSLLKIAGVEFPCDSYGGQCPFLMSNKLFQNNHTKINAMFLSREFYNI